jgi:hypothetical protein
MKPPLDLLPPNPDSVWIAKAEFAAGATRSPLTASRRCHHMYQAATATVSFSPIWPRIGDLVLVSRNISARIMPDRSTPKA